MSVERDIRFDLIARLCPNTTGAELRSVATEVRLLLTLVLSQFHTNFVCRPVCLPFAHDGKLPPNETSWTQWTRWYDKAPNFLARMWIFVYLQAWS